MKAVTTPANFLPADSAPGQPTKPRQLELRGIAKTYETPDGNSIHRFQALRSVNLTFRTGCIHTVLGENGAGKSTLMHIISGLINPSEGTLYLGGARIILANSADALRSGIAMVHQRPRLADGLSVLENVLVGLPGISARRRERSSELAALAAEWDISINLRHRAQHLSPAGRLHAALLSALFRKPDFLVLDEPTSVLAPEDRERFLNAVKRGADRGLGIILITHKLDEALRWSDRITVLRHGAVVFDSDSRTDTGPLTVSREDLADLLDPVENAHYADANAESPAAQKTAAPTEKAAPFNSKPPESGILPRLTCRLRAENLSASPKNRDPVQNVTFTAEPGSITGIFGAPGSGLKTLEDLLAGMLGEGAGHITLEDAGSASPIGNDPEGKQRLRFEAGKLSPRALRNAGIAFVPSNRTSRGSDPSLTAADMLLPYRQNAFLRSLKTEHRWVEDTLAAERVEARPSRGAHTLSGGQLQRLIVARELSEEPSVLILAEPEWGLDIRSVAILRERLRAAANRGTAVLILTDAPDSMHDRSFYDSIFTLREGTLP